MPRWMIVVAGLLLVAAGLAGWQYVASAVPVETTSLARGTIEEFIEERGTTRLAHTYDITMPVNGRLEKIDLAEGDTVAENQVVARIAAVDLENEVAEAQAAVDRLTASLAENDDHSVEMRTKEQAEQFVDSMKHTVNAAAARKIASAKQVEFAQKFLTRAQELRQRDANTVEDVEKADVEYVERQVAYQTDVLTWQASQSILIATELLPKIIDAYVARKSLTGEVLEKQRAEALVRLERAKLNRTRGSMHSPLSGIVLEKNYDDEQFVAAGSALLRIGRLEDLEIAVDVLSQDAGRIEVGTPARIHGLRIRGAEPESLNGSVKRIYPQGFTKISSLGVEEQRVKVIVALDEASLALLQESRVGVDYRVRVRLLTAAKPDAVIVSRSAMFRGPVGDWQVFVIRKGRAKRQVIEVGLLNDDHAEMIGGITPADLLIQSPDNYITEGVRVRASVNN